MQGRIIDAAVDVTSTAGWSSVTMAGLAEIVGVSRQTVYNEFGSKPALAEAMVQHELAVFLTVVEAAFDRSPHDPVEAIRDAARGVLELAQDNVLLRAIASATHGADTELLPLLTTRSHSLMGAASTVMADRLAASGVGGDDPRIGATVDAVVRLVLSHVVRPTRPPARAADDIAWVAGRLLEARRVATASA